MFPTSKTKLHLFISILFLLGSFGLFGGGLYVIHSSQANIADRKLELESEKVFSASLSGMKSALRESESEIQLFKSYFVDPNQTISYLNLIERLADNNQIEVTLSVSQSVEEVENEPAMVGILPIKIVAEGQSDDIFLFYKTLVTQPQLTNLSNLSMQSNAKKDLAFDVDSDQEAGAEESRFDTRSTWIAEVTLEIYQGIE